MFPGRHEETSEDTTPARPRRARQGRSRRLVVFSRYPQPGTTKTRLIPALGAEGAAELQRRMTLHLLRHARKLRRRSDVAVEVRFEGGDRRLMKRSFGGAVRYRSQGDGDLGDRMARAFRESFEHGSGRTVIVGTDCPDVSAGVLDEAFEMLGLRDLVLGPARDGGYYLIGLNRHAPELFRDMPWGTDEVLATTHERARSLGLSVGFVDLLQDVDRPEDLQAAAALEDGATSGLLSVVIPTLNEAENIGPTLESVASGNRVETVVVDGGSTDGTPELARRHGARVISSAPGRAHQMNRGAEAAGGNLLLFLHADTLLPEAYDKCARRILSEPGVAAGAFEFRLSRRSPILKLIERTTNFRARRLGVPYGDQGLFVTRRTFEAVGGFPDMPIMEDVEIVKRLRAQGRIVIANAPAATSARRWEELGEVYTSLFNQVMLLGYSLGVSPTRLARWYRGDGHADDSVGSSTETLLR